MKTLRLTLFTILVAATALLCDSRDLEKEACTSIMISKGASADGSVITSHTCDSWYRTWMRSVAPKDYPRDTVMSVYEGRMHTEYPESMDGVK